MNHSPQVFIVIVTYNGEAWLKTCLDSLVNQTDNLQVTIVDNASSDCSCQLIQDHYPDIHLIQQQTNLGFGRANNIGISHALKQGADFVFLLNQDAFLQPNCLHRLIMTSQEHPDYGILSPTHLNWDGNELEHYFSRFALKNTKFYSDYILNTNLQAIYDVPFVNAAGWLLPKRTFESIGGFDPMFIHYGEDNNYCQRVLYHGFKIGIVPKSFLCHAGVIRQDSPDYLFSDTYFRDEINKLQNDFGDINKEITTSDYIKVQRHVFKLIVLNLVRFNFKQVVGYLKKFRYFNKAILRIKQSRETNIVNHPHYLEL